MLYSSFLHQESSLSVKLTLNVVFIRMGFLEDRNVGQISMALSIVLRAVLVT